MKTFLDIESLILKLSKENKNIALNWYDSVHQHCLLQSKKYNVPLFKVVGIFSALSPMVSFKTNVKYCDYFLQGNIDKVKTFSAQKNKCYDILNESIETHEEVLEILNGQKTMAFYLNILFPEKSNNVTIDTWMVKFFGFKSLTPKRYNQASKLIQDYANKVNLLPHQIQALIWIGLRKNAY